MESEKRSMLKRMSNLQIIGFRNTIQNSGLKRTPQGQGKRGKSPSNCRYLLSLQAVDSQLHALAFLSLFHNQKAAETKIKIKLLTIFVLKNN